MKLTLGTGQVPVVEKVTEERIAAALASLPGRDDSYAILSKNEDSYIQTAGGALDGFMMECQDGSLEEHYRCLDEDLELSAITRVFQQYFKGDERWRTEHEWKPVDPSELTQKWWQFWK